MHNKTLENGITLMQIQAVVEEFYEQVRQHAQLAQPFSIVHDWPRHKEILSHFWWLMLGGERFMDYDYHVAPKHKGVGYTPQLLIDHWLPLFEQVVRKHVTSEQADGWLTHAYRIGRSLNMMHDHWVQEEGVF